MLDLGEVQLAPFGLQRLRRERVEQLDLEKLQLEVEKFLKKRPLMIWADKRSNVMKTLLLSEIDELLVELLAQSKLAGGSQRLLNRLNKAHISIQELVSKQDDADTTQMLRTFLEAYDLLFLSFGYASSNRIDLDFDRVYSEINGQGARNNAFERMQLLAAGVMDAQPAVAIEELLVVWSSLVSHQELYLDPNWIMGAVLRKDANNYPEEYFQFEHIYWNEAGKLETGSLELDEAEIAFDHRVRMLRLIRRALKLAQQDREMGLRREDHAQYAQLILNHRDQTSFSTLAKRLTVTLGQQGRVFTFEQLVSVESEPHRVVKGLEQLSRQNQVLTFPSAGRGQTIYDGTIARSM